MRDHLLHIYGVRKNVHSVDNNKYYFTLVVRQSTLYITVIGRYIQAICDEYSLNTVINKTTLN